MKFDGYREAEKIDKQISLLVKKYPIDKRNAHDWMKFCRTVGSGLQLLNKLALDMTCEECEEDCPEAGRRQKAETATTGLRVKRWIGAWPAKCQICPVDLGQEEYFVDGKTRLDSWCLMCPLCHTIYGVGLGLGKGQKYDSKTLEKLEG